MRVPPSLLALTTAALLAGGLTACGSDSEGGASVLRAEDLQNDIAQRLGASSGQTPSVTCPGDLAAKKGNALRCRADVEGQSLGVTVTVTGTEGGSAQYELQVDQASK